MLSFLYYFLFCLLVMCNCRLTSVCPVIVMLSRIYKRTVSFSVVRLPFNRLRRHVDMIPDVQRFGAPRIYQVDWTEPLTYRFELCLVRPIRASLELHTGDKPGIEF